MPNTFVSETHFAPCVIANRKVEQLCPKWLNTPLQEWFIDHCELRCEHYWSSEAQWRRWMLGEKGLEQLHRFISLWCKDFVRNPIRYRLEHPHKRYTK